MFNIIKYCQCSNNKVQYKKITTSTNNPKMSTKMRYSQYVRNTKPNNCCVDKTK